MRTPYLDHVCLYSMYKFGQRLYMCGYQIKVLKKFCKKVVLELLPLCTCQYFARPGGRRADPGEFDILKYLESKSPP